jgi:chromosome segregation ATPase
VIQAAAAQDVSSLRSQLAASEKEGQAAAEEVMTLRSELDAAKAAAVEEVMTLRSELDAAKAAAVEEAMNLRSELDAANAARASAEEAVQQRQQVPENLSSAAPVAKTVAATGVEGNGMR